MFQSQPTSSSTSVVVDAASGRPREIRDQGRRLRISDVEAVRDETAAYPARQGPRHVFVVRAAGRRYRLIHLLRSHDWTLELLEGEIERWGLASAA